MNAYPKLQTQLPNSWRIITETTDKPKCLNWHCRVCSLEYKCFKSCRACIPMQPCETDIQNQKFQLQSSDPQPRQTNFNPSLLSFGTDILVSINRPFPFYHISWQPRPWSTVLEPVRTKMYNLLKLSKNLDFFPD